jgi:hypothetical protein
MARIIIVDHQDMLGRLFPNETAKLPNYKRTTEIVYTIGKVDGIWGGRGDHVAGIAVRAGLWHGSKRMDAIVAIDLKACRIGGVSTSLSLDGSKNFDFQGFRRKVFDTLAHEYFHILQDWGAQVASSHPDAFSHAYGEEQKRSAWEVFLEKPLLLFDPEKHRKVAYHRNKYETSAFQAGSSALNRFISEVDTKKWDGLMPISEMESLV